MTSISKIAKPQAFSRYTRDCFIVWPNATAPLSMIFDTSARQAWVANILNQLGEGQLSADDMIRLRNVTKPRSQNERQKLLAASVDSLSFSEVLMRATLLANVGCSEVLAEYGERIIIKAHG